MRISTKGRYGTRAMVTLASHYKSGLLHAGQIADEQGISKKYLEALLGTLKASGLVSSERGKHGGYALARPPDEISLYDILCPLQEVFGIVHCTENWRSCVRRDACVTQEIWIALKDATDLILSETTLADLLARRQQIAARPIATPALRSTACDHPSLLADKRTKSGRPE